MVLVSAPTAAGQTWILLLTGALENVDGNDHLTVLKAQLEGIPPASLRAGRRQVEIENHGEFLQRKLLCILKAVGFTVTFLLEPQLDLHNQGRN